MLKIYLDLCSYNRSYDDQSQMRIRLKTEAKLFIQSAIIDTERFISMIRRDNFDYTEWRRELFKGESIEDVHAIATEHEKKQNNL